jgi:hypothetical protein
MMPSKNQRIHTLISKMKSGHEFGTAEIAKTLNLTTNELGNILSRMKTMVKCTTKLGHEGAWRKL